MSCSGFNNCQAEEVNRIGFPSDKDSLYAQKIYDKQTAANRCYANVPRTTNIIEGFGLPKMTMENMIKIGIIILLIVLFISLIYDYGAAANTNNDIFVQNGGGYGNESYFELTPITLLDEY